MQTKACKICNKEFKVRNKGQKFCSYECANKSKETCRDIECPTCGKTFHQKVTVQKYCSPHCIPHSRPRKLKDIICPICKKEFHPIRATQKTCSPDCREEYTRLKLKNNRKSYSDTEKERRIKKWTGSALKMKSKTNEKYGAILESAGYVIDCYDFALGGKYYDIKVGNVLIEINPYATHNTIRMPKFADGCTPRASNYHYEKCKLAVDNGYKYINVRDRTTESELFDMISKDFVYEGGPNLHRYNPKTKDHLLDDGFDKGKMLGDGYVSIYDSGVVLFKKELQCN